MRFHSVVLLVSLSYLWGCAAMDERDRQIAEHSKICFATLTPNTEYCKK